MGIDMLEAATASAWEVPDATRRKVAAKYLRIAEQSLTAAIGHLENTAEFDYVWARKELRRIRAHLQALESEVAP